MTCSGWDWVTAEARSNLEKITFESKRRVESALDFGEIAMGIFDEIEGVIRSGECRLHIAQNGVVRT